MNNARAWSFALLMAGIGFMSCAEGLRTAPRGSVPEELEFTEVDFPPPPSEIELIEADPGPPCVWVDGHYRWSGRRWQWEPGAWVKPPPECYYVPMVMTRAQNQLRYAAPRWYPEGTTASTSDAAREACAKPQRCGAPLQPGGQDVPAAEPASSN